jgi:hypothetical protein
MEVKNGSKSLLNNNVINKKAPNNSSTSNFSIGKVFGIVQGENLPTPELATKYEQGTIFYMDFNKSKDYNTISSDLLDSICKKAFPLNNNIFSTPLPGELVPIINGPSISSISSPNIYQAYYLPSFSIFNNSHDNRFLLEEYKLSPYFLNNPDIKDLYRFEGDTVLEGRFGNSIRLSSTLRSNINNREVSSNNINPWSESGENGDPIIIIGNHKGKIEDINVDGSSIYITENQTIPLKILESINNSRIKESPLNPRIGIPNYSNPQIILNSDRIVINSKKDEVLIYGKSGVDLESLESININSRKEVILHSPKIYLGLHKSIEYPHSSALKGDETITYLNDILESIREFASELINVVSTEKGSKLLEINNAASSLTEKLENIQKSYNKGENLLSSTVYIA